MWANGVSRLPNAILASFPIRLGPQSFFKSVGGWRHHFKCLNVVLVFWIDEKMFVWYNVFDCVIDVLFIFVDSFSSLFHVDHFPLQIKKTRSIYVRCLQRMFVAISNDIIKDDVISLPSQSFGLVAPLVVPSLQHCAWATQLFRKKCRSGGEPLATLCSIWPAQDLNPRPPVLEPSTLPFRLSGRW